MSNETRGNQGMPTVSHIWGYYITILCSSSEVLAKDDIFTNALQWYDLKIGHRDNSPCDGRYGGMVYYDV